MKKEFSTSWVSSKQPRKQRKFRVNAPLHRKHGFLAVHLSEDLKRETGRRSIPVRKGDDVRILRGSFKGSSGVVDHVNSSKSKVYVESAKIKKVDGSEALRPIDPSNLVITKLSLDDKKRKNVIERKRPASLEKPAKAQKPPEKEEKTVKEKKPEPKKAEVAEKKAETK